MPEQIYYQPQRRKKDQEDEASTEVSSPSGQRYERKESTYDAEKADQSLGDIDKAIAAHEDTKKDTDALREKEENPEGASGQAPWKVGGAYGDKDEKSLLAQAKKIRLSRRKKAAGGLLGGGTAIGIVFTLLAGQVFKVPITVGNIHANMPGSRVTRNIVEKRMEKMLAKYLIDRANGASNVREGSAMDKLYKSFDKVGLAKIIEQRNGIKIIRGAGGARVFLDGKEVGSVRNERDFAALKKKNRALDKASRETMTKTFHFFRFTLNDVRRYINLTTGKTRFSPPEFDEDKTKEENIAKNIDAPAVAEADGKAVGAAFETLGCLLEDQKCPSDSEARKQPVDTASRTSVDVDINGGQDKGQQATELENNTNEATQKALEERAKSAAPEHFDITQRIIFHLVEKMIGAAAAKTIIGSIPVIGWINTGAALLHAADVAISSNLIANTSVYIKELMYSTVSAQWAGYAHSVEAGKMNLAYIAYLNARLTGANRASTHKYMSNKDPATGEPVSPQVGSDLEEAWGANATKVIFKVQKYTILLPFTLWYTLITVPFNHLSDAAFNALIFLFKTSPAYAIAQQILKAAFGDDWETKLATWAMTMFFNLFGLIVNALAYGAELYNIIYTGWDVIMQRYIQTNLGGQEVSAKQGTYTPGNVFGAAEENYRQDLATLPLKQRLVGLDSEYSSVFSKMVEAAPSTLDPATVIASFWHQLASLPATLMAIVSGRTWAAGTVNQSAQLTGVAQFNVLGVDTAPISQQVLNDADPQCPPNRDGFSNICQADKSTVTIGMCMYTDCPQLVDTPPAAAAATTAGAVSATGDSQALAKQILAMAQSPSADHSKPGVWFSTFGGARQDLETVAAGFKITSCVPPFKPVTLDPGLLNLIIAASKSYNIGIGFFVSGHDCDNAYHPKGMAMDVNYINGSHMTDGNLAYDGPIQGISASLVKKFMEDMARMMPAGKGGLGQSGCTPLVNASYPSTVNSFPDSCNHLHIDVEP